MRASRRANMNNEQLESKSKEIRRSLLEMIHNGGSGHPGGSLSVTDILVYLYYEKLSQDPKNPKDPDRDRLFLSKGHAAPAQYSILADRGYFPVEWKAGFRKFGEHLQGHPDKKKVPGIESCSGSLGQGTSVAIGCALAGKLGKKDYKVYLITGDGEIQEGQTWEAAMSAAHYKLDNLIWIVDNNGLQIDGTNDQVMSLGNLAEKYRAFGFEVFEIDGHDFDQIRCAIDMPSRGKPKCIIAHTVKGKGVSFMENQVGWHGKGINDEVFNAAMKELA